MELGLRFDVFLETQDIQYNRIVMRLPSENSEYLYGLGEQFTDFNLKGQKYTIWTREQGEKAGENTFMFYVFYDQENVLLYWFSTKRIIVRPILITLPQIDHRS